MHFNILSTGRGVATTLRPVVCTESMHFAFDNAEGSMTAIFSNDEEKAVYREVVDGECEIPASSFEGNVHVAVVLDGNRIKCDDVIVSKVDGTIVVTPNFAKIIRHVVTQDQEISDLKDALADSNRRIEELAEKVRSYYEGYDLI